MSTPLVEAAVAYLNTKLNEATGGKEDNSISRKVRDEKGDMDAIHTHTVGHEHIYSGGQPDGGTHIYHVHNAQTGKTHTVSLEHDGRTMSHKAVRKAASKEISDAAVKAIHKNHKEEMSYDDY